MAKRHKDAYAIQQGACNPSGIAHAIIDACRECRNSGINPCIDSAVRLMVHQLAYICGIGESMELGDYHRMMEEVENAS